MIQHIRVSPSTHAAIRTLVGRAVERIFVTGEVRVVRRLRDDARCLAVHSPDGQRYSGVLIVHDNRVTTGLVVPTPTETAHLDVALAGLPADSAGDQVTERRGVRSAEHEAQVASNSADPATAGVEAREAVAQ